MGVTGQIRHCNVLIEVAVCACVECLCLPHINLSRLRKVLSTTYGMEPSLIPASLVLCRLQNVAATSLPREAVLQLVSCSGNLFVMFMQSVLSGFFSLLWFFFLHSLLLDLIVILPS